MAETLYATSHITGDCPSPSNALGAPDGTWAGPTSNNTSWDSRWAIDNPALPLTESATQTITVRARKTNHSTNPTCAVELWENGSLVTTLVSSTAVSSTTGVDLSGNFNSSQVTNPDNVEVRVIGSVGGGSPGNRASLQIDSITWTADTSSGTISGSGSPTQGADTASASGTVTNPSPGYMDTPNPGVNGDLAEGASPGFYSTGTLEAIVCVRMPDWTLGGSPTAIAGLLGSGSGTTAWALEQQVNGDGTATTFRFRWWWDNGTEQVASAGAGALGDPGDNTHKWLRVVWNPTGGALGGLKCDFYHSDDPIGTDPESVSWTHITDGGDDSLQSIRTGAGRQAMVGGNTGTGAQPKGGEYFVAYVYYNGTRVWSADWRDDDQGWSSPPATDLDGNSWSFNTANVTWVAPTGQGISGSGATTQGADTASASGAHTPPTFSGTGAASQDDQIAAGAGAVVFSGSGAVSQDDQAGSAAGTHSPPVFSGTASPTQADQTTSASGTHTPPLFSGSGGATQEDQTAAASGRFLISGAAALAQDDQVGAASGQFTAPNTSGSAAITEQDQTATGSGTHTPPVFSGTGAASQADDTAAGAGVLVFSGLGTAAQDDQTGTGSGTHAPPAFSGSAAPTQAADIASGSGSVLSPFVSGSGAATQDDQVGIGVGSFTPETISGAGTATQADQVGAGAGTHTGPVVSGSANPTQEDQTGAATGQFLIVVSGSGSVAEGSGVGVAAGLVRNRYTGSGSPKQGNAVARGFGGPFYEPSSLLDYRSWGRFR